MPSVATRRRAYVLRIISFNLRPDEGTPVADASRRRIDDESAPGAVIGNTTAGMGSRDIDVGP